MSWLRIGDNAATYPALLAVTSATAADDRLVNEVAGFVFRCAAHSAGHLTNGVVDAGLAQLLAPTRWEALIDAAVHAGLLVPKGRGARRVWHLVEDPEFIHIRPRAEVEWERQRRRDNANPGLTVPVRLRDGDACRWCGKVVNWNHRRGTRGGTYDHLQPGKPATIDTLVVACTGCNSARGDGQAWSRDLLPVPLSPIYGSITLELLATHGATVPAAPSPSADPHPAGERALGGPTTSGRTPTPAVPSAGVRDVSGDLTSPLSSKPVHAASPQTGMTSADAPPRSADPSRNRGFGPGRVGSGRVGSGPPPPGSGPRRSNRRSRRGGGGSVGST